MTGKTDIKIRCWCSEAGACCGVYHLLFPLPMCILKGCMKCFLLSPDWNIFSAAAREMRVAEFTQYFCRGPWSCWQMKTLHSSKLHHKAIPPLPEFVVRHRVERLLAWSYQYFFVQEMLIQMNVMCVEYGRKCDVKYGKDVVENTCDHFDGSDWSIVIEGT